MISAHYCPQPVKFTKLLLTIPANSVDIFFSAKEPEELRSDLDSSPYHKMPRNSKVITPFSGDLTLFIHMFKKIYKVNT